MKATFAASITALRHHWLMEIEYRAAALIEKAKNTRDIVLRFDPSFPGKSLPNKSSLRSAAKSEDLRKQVGLSL